MRIGFIGTGNMGKPMASNLIRAGHQLTVHDLRREAAIDLLESGATWADSPEDAAQGNEFVFTSLPGPADVEAVTLGERGVLAGMAAGTVYADLSTNSPTVIRRIHQRFQERGFVVLDAPVSGGVYGAANATLAVMVGGDKEVYQRVRPALEAIGSNVFYCGAIGNGMVCKICNNLLSMGIGNLLAESLTLGVKAGVDLAVLVDVIGKSSGGKPPPRGEAAAFPIQGQLRAGVCRRAGSEGRQVGNGHGQGVRAAHGPVQPH